MQDKRIVVTGLGPLCPLAIGQKNFHEAQLAGKSGISKVTKFDASNFPTQIAGEVHMDMSQYFDRKELRRIDPFIQLAVAAADLALQDSGLDLDAIDRENVGVLIGSGIGGVKTWEDQSSMALKTPWRISPFTITMLSNNIAATTVSMRYGFMGPSSTTATACTTGADAIAHAYRMMQFGDAEVMLVGGSEAAVTSFSMGGFSAMRALSKRNDEPEKASRPFSASRDGFVLSEGAAVLTLETLEHAKA
ncbi:MAG: beta-ketoacyl synthase N-terminal-like domain-containing protein [Deinococcales bacterium]